jgi:exopolyphosphatase/guanosine-5'-triphosphate,3'-diphosphate pyrophosphatase
VRIAAIDIGTNSVHMVIAEAGDANGFEVIDREREVVQIGRGSFHTSRLRSESIRRTVDALQRFVQLARRHQVDRILCTATAAVREAKNGGDFLSAARQIAGVTPRVIPAAEEGRLIYLAVKAALPLDLHPALIVDIGGGSMQLVVGNRDRLIEVVSVPLGALRLTELIEASDPPDRSDLQRLQRLIRKGSRAALETVVEHEPEKVYGSSGSIHALAHIAHWSETGQPIEHINGHVLTLDSLKRITRRLQRMTTAERERLPGIDAQRAEIIVPGAMVLTYVLEEVGADEIILSDFGVREGLVTDYITNHAAEIATTGRVEDLRLRSVLQCIAKFQAPVKHTEHVAKLALELFDGLRDRHHLDASARELLQFAALLHDVGSVIGYDGHGEHSYYIIKNANLRGMTAEELELIAIIAHYHGKARPRKRDRAYRALAKPQRRMVRWLSAILCVAESLDRSHYQLIRSLTVKRRHNGIVIRAAAKREAQLELWSSRGRLSRLSRLLGEPVRIVPERGSDARATEAEKRKARRGEEATAPRRPATPTAPRSNGRPARREARVVPLSSRAKLSG